MPSQRKIGMAVLAVLTGCGAGPTATNPGSVGSLTGNLDGTLWEARSVTATVSSRGTLIRSDYIVIRGSDHGGRTITLEFCCANEGTLHRSSASVIVDSTPGLSRWSAGASDITLSTSVLTSERAVGSVSFEARLVAGGSGPKRFDGTFSVRY